jgi:hypothetical protein
MITMSTERGTFDLSVTPSLHIATFGAVCLFLATVCVVTRIRTGQHRNRDTDVASEIKNVEVVPYFVPWLGSAISFVLRFHDFVTEAQFVAPQACQDQLAN